MKQGWELKKLGEVCDLINGSTPLKSNKDYWVNGSFPWFTIEDLRIQGRVINYTNQFITKIGLKKLKILPVDTVLLCCTASIGEYAITKIELTTNQQFNGLVIKDKNKLSPSFLLYFSSTLREKLYNLSGKATIDFISISKLKNIEIPIPPLPEQERIVSILDQVFSAIEQAKANAEKNLKNAKELFDSYLNGVFTNKGEDWEEKTLKEISKINYGYTEKTNFEEIGPKFLRITDIQNIGVDWDLFPYCKCNEIDFKKYKLETGDIVFARTGATTGKSYLLKEPPNAVFASYLIRLQLKNKENFIPEFISYFFMTNLYWDKIKSGISGSAQGGVNASKLGEIKLYYPKSLMLQQDIVKKLNAVLLEAKQLEELYQQKITQLEDLKKSILGVFAQNPETVKR
jgi:type I restriction enzyme S subunit